jgi:hypothetical protein
MVDSKYISKFDKKLTQKLLIVIILVITIISVAILLIKNTKSDQCINYLIEETVSPDSIKKAIIFRRECKDIEQQLHFSIMDKIYKLNNDHTANVLIKDFNQADLVIWESKDILQIKIDLQENIYKQEFEVDGVVVEYVQL